jgi:hypothetical protein
MISKFKTDGCSGNMSWMWARIAAFRNMCIWGDKWSALLPWNEDCIEHDRTYHVGGTKLQKFKADTRLMVKVAEKGYPIIGILMFLGVQLGGYGWRAEVGYRIIKVINWKAIRWNWGYGWGSRYKYESDSKTS